MGKNSFFLALIVVLSGCSAKYGKLTRRVKSKPLSEKEIVQVDLKHKGIKAENVNVEIEKNISPKIPGPVQEIEFQSKSKRKLHVKEEAPEIRLRNEPSPDEIKEKLRKADQLAMASMIFALTGIITLGIGFLIAIILSLFALDIYWKYDYPRSERRYRIALITLIVSGLIALFVGSGIILSVLFF